MATGTKANATEIGRRIGQAIARDAIAQATADHRPAEGEISAVAAEQEQDAAGLTG